MNGYPENDNNLGYALLQQGAIGTVSASRVSWSGCFSPPANPTGGANYNLSYHYTMRMLNGEPAGRALYRTKEDVTPSGSWMNKMDFNLYGDPTTSLLKPFDAKYVDVMQILDNSGSMSGYTSSSHTDRKIDILQAAANQFVDMMEMDGENKLGLVKFSTTASTLLNLQTFDGGVQTSAHTNIGGIHPDAMTSVGAGMENERFSRTQKSDAPGYRR